MKENRLKEFLDKPIMKEFGCVPRREGLWYALGVAGQNISCGLVSVWFFFYCTDVAYYSTAVVGIVLSIARIWDAVNDPLMGILIDRHRFKNGEKLRPWLKIAPIVAGVMAAIMFIKPPYADKSLVFQGIFVLLIYLVYDMSFTVQDVSMWGMTAVMSPHSDERGQLAQWGRIGASVGGWIPGLIPVFISVSKQIGLSQQVLFAGMGVVLGLGGMLLSMSAAKGRERVLSDPQNETSSVWANLSDLFKNKMVMMVLIGSILSGFSLGIPQIYFFKYKVAFDVMGFHIDGETASFLFGIFSGLPGMLAMFIVPWFAKKVGGMRNILILSCGSAIIMRLFCYAVGYEGYRMLIVTLLMGIASIPAGMTGIAMTALFGDSIDYMEYKTGRRPEAITFAAQTFCSKIVGAINIGVTSVLFTILNYSAEDYDAGLPLSPLFDKWVWPLFILGPIVGAVLNIIPLLFIKYPNSLKEKVEAELIERRAKEKETTEV